MALKLLRKLILRRTLAVPVLGAVAMSLARYEFDRTVDGATAYASSKTLSRKTTRDCPYVTLRFSEADYAKLKDLADGMALSTFILARALSEELPKRCGPKAAPIQDQAALAQVLALLGQSRIASNFNQLAYHANISALSIENREHSQINEAYDNVILMRRLLLKALGKRSASPSSATRMSHRGLKSFDLVFGQALTPYHFVEDIS